jgi:hypothetical protein
MRASRIGFILCRLAAVATAVWYVPSTVATTANWLWLGREEYRGYYGAFALAELAVLLGASIAWAAAGWMGRSIVGDDDGGDRVSIDAAQFAAIGLAFIGVLALVYSASGISTLIADLFGPYPAPQSPWLLLLGGGGNAALLQAALGILLMCLAPRLGIWLENTGVGDEEAGDDPA